MSKKPIPTQLGDLIEEMVWLQKKMGWPASGLSQVDPETRDGARYLKLRNRINAIGILPPEGEEE